jgi:hypothetical protein
VSTNTAENQSKAEIFGKPRWLALCISVPDPDPDPALSVCDLQDANKNIFFCLLLFEGTFTVHHSSKIKSHKQ